MSNEICWAYYDVTHVENNLSLSPIVCEENHTQQLQCDFNVKTTSEFDWFGAQYEFWMDWIGSSTTDSFIEIQKTHSLILWLS